MYSSTSCPATRINSSETQNVYDAKNERMREQEKNNVKNVMSSVVVGLTTTWLSCYHSSNDVNRFNRLKNVLSDRLLPFVPSSNTTQKGVVFLAQIQYNTTSIVMRLVRPRIKLLLKRRAEKV
jgi:hypothetical protein